MRSEIKQWAEDHGEIPITMEQFQAEERQAKQDRLERGKEKFTLELTADELDWLFFDILETSEKTLSSQNRGSEALLVHDSRDEWLEQVTEQGYVP